MDDESTSVVIPPASTGAFAVEVPPVDVAAAGARPTTCDSGRGAARVTDRIDPRDATAAAPPRAAIDMCVVPPEVTAAEDKEDARTNPEAGAEIAGLTMR
jgi:hypothetical protein